jgi:hypothetical protein
MKFNDQLQLDLPDAFPGDAFSDFMRDARSLFFHDNIDSWKEFLGASNLIGWRYRASYEGMEDYLSSWKTLGVSAGFEEIFKREQSLFTMFVSGSSCIDSSCYALYAIASHPRILSLPFGPDEQRHCNPKSLHQALASSSRGRVLYTTLDIILKSDYWILWNKLRNRMTHRSNLPHHTFGSFGSQPPPAKPIRFAATSSTPELEGNEDFLKNLFVEFTTSLRNVLIAGTTFLHGT